jgi:hypothetical protein
MRSLRTKENFSKVSLAFRGPLSERRAKAGPSVFTSYALCYAQFNS